MITFGLVVVVSMTAGNAALASADAASPATPPSTRTAPDEDPSSASRPQLPVVYNFLNGLQQQLQHPEAPPPGANDWSCRPRRGHPYPVVLVHGTLGTMTDEFQALSPLLKNNGYCVFALNYGGKPGDMLQGYGPIETSAQQLADFIDKVLTATHRTKVDIVGHSQGGVLPRYYMKFLGGAAKVHTLVGLAPPNHGTTFWGIANLVYLFPILGQILSAFCAACAQQIAGSPFLERLNAGSETIPGVNYTVIATRFDEIVTPYSSAFLNGASVRNILIQQDCGLDFIEHLALPYDSVTDQEVLNALDPAHAEHPRCTLVLPFIGG